MLKPIFFINNINQEFLFYKKNLNLYINYSINFKIFIINNINIVSLLLKKNLINNIPFINDYTFLNKKYLFIIFKTYFFNNKLNFLILNKKNYKSISNIYSNSNWMEREIKEFNNFYFINLKDTRRLLLDYTIDIISLNYSNNNNIFYDIII